jgi:hypothetical protein
MKLMRTILLSSALFDIAIAFGMSSPRAKPPDQAKANGRAQDVVDVKILCDQEGHCTQRGRTPVVRWVYGDRAFHGPGYYTGPGYYGSPASHWSWWGLLGPW